MNNIVWSSEDGDMRNRKKKTEEEVNEKEVKLRLRRLTAGKGRTVVEITGLPDNRKWCRELAGDIKKSFGVAGTYKKNKIEIHGEIIDKVMDFLKNRGLNYKKTGG